MRKELLLAILAGGALGLVIAFGIWRINSALSPSKKGGTSTEEANSKSSSLITIAKPSDNDVITQSPVEISGITKPGAVVVVSGEENDYLTLADNKGSFSQEISLVGGTNQIILTYFDKDKNPIGQTLTLVYSSEFAKLIKPTQAPSEEQVSSDSVRQKVQEKVEAALSSPTSYLGTVTDIAEATIQLKSATGEIQQISTSEKPTVIKEGKTPKEVKLTDIAIGDFIIAMGFRNGNHVLSARRILISSPLPPIARRVILGTVNKLSKKDITLLLASGKTQLILPDENLLVFSFEEGKSTKIKFANIGEGKQIIAIGELSKDNFVARTIFIISTL